ncbi:hypothetical protein J3459_016961 [Metarhizium acridum]|nr:hypothetical protein J3459_016961 [Metarhizium acridum]
MPPQKELVSALDHYEEAMEKEALGNMGDSLKLYRKAYRVSPKESASRYVDLTNVDGPRRASPIPREALPQHKQQPQSAPAQITAPTDATPAGGDAPVLLPIKDRIASFAGLQIEAAPADTDGTPPAPCPLSSLPASSSSTSCRTWRPSTWATLRACRSSAKPLAYLVATEQRIWRQVCLGERFGFAGMHRRWNKTVEWEALEEDDGDGDGDGLVGTTEEAAVTASLVPDPYASWGAMFRRRPRVRFNGCYISTVNYVRSGQASTNQATWGGAPIHIVTYYRYLRFFRDGTSISLLTTLEPTHVVHHLTRDLLHLHRDNAHAYLPSAAMQRAYKGRWRLVSRRGGRRRLAGRPPPRGG